MCSKAELDKANEHYIICSIVNCEIMLQKRYSVSLRQARFVDRHDAAVSRVFRVQSHLDYCTDFFKCLFFWHLLAYLLTLKSLQSGSSRVFEGAGRRRGSSVALHPMNCGRLPYWTLTSSRTPLGSVLELCGTF